MSKLYTLPLIAGALVIVAAVGGCTRPKEEIDHDNLPEDVKEAAMAIIVDSPAKFASAVNYPLPRPYPLHDIKDSAEMVGYYNTLVDDSLKHKVKQTPDSLWQSVGWRGWTLDDGSYLWIDEGKVYQVNYLSKRENELLDSLRTEEISSLQPDMRPGWIPVLCIIDSVNNEIFRIDSDETLSPPQYRLAGYGSDADLSGTPSIVLYGNLDYEGSMAVRYYHFEDSIGNSADYSPDIVSEEDTIPEFELTHSGKVKKVKVRPGYWLDHIKSRQERMNGVGGDSLPDASRSNKSEGIKGSSLKPGKMNTIGKDGSDSTPEGEEQTTNDDNIQGE
ncbi:MAG: hypothetical protein HDS22_00355 [Bacteroides sp.]|nr:hypothetical protein [Bacteroides sp.]